MLPTLPVECEIEVAPLSQRAPLGSLVVFAAGDILVAHRLVRRAGGRWMMQGDGRWVPDPPIGAEQVLGLVVAANLGGRRCWPGRAESALRWFWVVRYHVLKSMHFTWHVWRNLLRFGE
jgi:hypothetical protein